jgi:hypothetical protein
LINGQLGVEDQFGTRAGQKLAKRGFRLKHDGANVLSSKKQIYGDVGCKVSGVSVMLIM